MIFIIQLFSRLFFRKDGKLLQFVRDLHSEKLHRDFHNPPPPTQQPTTTESPIEVTNVFLKHFFSILFNCHRNSAPIFCLDVMFQFYSFRRETHWNFSFHSNLQSFPISAVRSLNWNKTKSIWDIAKIFISCQSTFNDIIDGKQYRSNGPNGFVFYRVDQWHNFQWLSRRIEALFHE